MKPHSKEETSVSVARTFHVRAANNLLRVQSIVPHNAEPVKNQPTLVFLHEGLGCIELWRDFPETLCASTGCA
jgi:hypothetical protein